MGVSSSLYPDNSSIGLTLTFVGPFAADVLSFVKFNKVGPIVFMSIPAVAAGCTLSAIGSAVVTAGVPAAYRPAATVNTSIPIVSNSLTLSATGLLSVASTGNITITKDLAVVGTWAVTGNNGWAAQTIFWSV